MLLTIADEDKEDALSLAKRFASIGYGLYATKGTAQFLRDHGLFVHEVDKIEEGSDNSVVDIIREGKVNFVINTMSQKIKTQEPMAF